MAKKSRNDYYPDYSVFREENGDVLKKAVRGLSKVLGTATEKYKDTVFRMLLNDKKVALEVYNAMNGSDYDDPDEIIITTLENAVYMGVRNDASFIIAYQLMVYEHQSTVNPNMPIFIRRDPLAGGILVKHADAARSAFKCVCSSEKS